MTAEEFIEKMESEGVAYAFTDYGLKESDLDPDLFGSPFWIAVKDTRIAYERAAQFSDRIYASAPVE